MNVANDLFLLMFSLSQLQNKNMIIKLFTESVSEAFKPAVIRFSEHEEKKAGFAEKVATRNSTYGYVFSHDHLTAESISLLQNAVQMLAVILERLSYENKLLKDKQKVESVANDRLEEIKTYVEELESTKLASLNLVDDLTEEIDSRKKAQDALLSEQAFSNNIIHSMPGLFYIFEEKTARFIRRNANWAKISGYSETELDKMTALDVVADKELCANRMQEVYDKGYSAMENPLLTKSGKEIPYYFTGKKVIIDEKPYLVGMGIDITKRIQAEKDTQKFKTISDNAVHGNTIVDLKGKIVYINEYFANIHGYTVEELIGQNLSIFHNDEQLPAVRKINEALIKNLSYDPTEVWHTHKDGSAFPMLMSGVVMTDENGSPQHLTATAIDISSLKRAEQALEKRLVAFTQPLDDTQDIIFDELFNVEDIQKLQDDFANATGVASIITYKDGTPITRPSNFCRLCKDVIRKTEKGLSNCFKSDAVLGSYNTKGPIIQTCLSGGLWDAGTSISVGGKHIANWLIGQVRDKTQTEEKMRVYAKEIGADENRVIEAFNEVPAMSHEQFKQVAQALFTLANQLSAMAYQNIQQSRFIAERRKFEAELKANSDLLNSIFRSAPTGIGIMINRVITMVNDKMKKISGYSEKELIGKSARLLYPDDETYDWVGEVKYKQIAEYGSGTVETKWIRKDGAIIDILLSSTPINKDNLEKGVTFTVLDITDRKKMEDELKEHQDHLEEMILLRTRELENKNKELEGKNRDTEDSRQALTYLLEDLNDTKVELEKSNFKMEAANKELEAFSYSVSHDLRAPLRSISGFSQALMEDNHEQLDDMGKDFLNRVCSATQNMSDLIDNMLKLSRITRISLNRTKVNLSNIIQEKSEILRKSDSDRAVEFHIQPDQYVKADENLLNILTENLVNNAWKFTAKKEKTIIEFGPCEERFQDDSVLSSKQVFYIRDNGAGFDMAYANKLFGAFQRLHTDVEFEGTGIGLATVQRIINRHGGKIWAEGEVNKGAVFYFTLD